MRLGFRTCLWVPRQRSYRLWGERGGIARSRPACRAIKNDPAWSAGLRHATGVLTQYLTV